MFRIGRPVMFKAMILEKKTDGNLHAELNKESDEAHFLNDSIDNAE